MGNAKIILITLMILVSSLTAGCSGAQNSRYTKSGLYFDTIVSIDIYGASKDNADYILSECMKLCDKYQQLFDETIKTSDIYMINTSGGKSVKVDHDTVKLIESALYYSKLTEGRFDISIDPVSDLWDFHEDNAHVPSGDEINNALTNVGYENITVDSANDTVTVTGNATIDAGAVAKGYIADRIADYLISCPINGAIVNMGGDLKLIGTKNGRDPFNIGINDPFSDDSVRADLSLTDTAVATSGTYERCITVGDRKYHHILDPSTGYPVDTDIESVTVICDNATSADCLCTVLIILGADDAIELVENTKDTEAYIIKSDGQVMQSSGMAKYIRQ